MTTITLVKNFLYFMNSPNYHCLKSVQIRSFSGPHFLRSKSPYSARIQENTDQKKFRIWTLCMQCTVGKLQISTFINNERGGCTFMHLTQCFLINITAAISLKQMNTFKRAGLQWLASNKYVLQIFLNQPQSSRYNGLLPQVL